MSEGLPISSKSSNRNPLGSRFKAPPCTLAEEHVEHLVQIRTLSLVCHDDGLVDVKVQNQPCSAGKLLCQNDARRAFYEPGIAAQYFLHITM